MARIATARHCVPDLCQFRSALSASYVAWQNLAQSLRPVCGLEAEVLPWHVLPHAAVLLPPEFAWV